MGSVPMTIIMICYTWAAVTQFQQSPWLCLVYACYALSAVGLIGLQK